MITQGFGFDGSLCSQGMGYGLEEIVQEIVEAFSTIESARLNLLEKILNQLQTIAVSPTVATKTELAQTVFLYEDSLDDLRERLDSLEEQIEYLRSRVGPCGKLK